MATDGEIKQLEAIEKREVGLEVGFANVRVAFTNHACGGPHPRKPRRKQCKNWIGHERNVIFYLLMSFFHCPNCPQTFRLNTTFEAHTRGCLGAAESSEASVVCGICSLSFETEYEYHNHFSGDVHRSASRRKRRQQVCSISKRIDYIFIIIFNRILMRMKGLAVPQRTRDELFLLPYFSQFLLGTWMCWWTQ